MTIDESLVIEAAGDLVALWDSPKIKGLNRADRNAAIDDTRLRLKNAIDALKRPSFPTDEIEAVTRAIIDAHPRCDHHANYDSWIEWEKEPAAYNHEHAKEWLAARRLEAKSALAVIRRS